MFFKLNLTKTVFVPPVYFGPMLTEAIRDLLCSNVEGSLDQSVGAYVIAVLDITSTGSGKLMDTGEACYHIKYLALVQKHFNGEVVDAVATRIMPPQGVFFKVGALTAYVRLSSEQWVYDPDAKGYVNVMTRTTALKDGSVGRIRLHNCRAREHSVQLTGELVV
eukprot:PhM_4_TR5526/c0_g1_i1/m.66936/K03015/RPB7, POLR2G; DNA-directed RNA polymerase II subunit RPB7